MTAASKALRRLSPHELEDRRALLMECLDGQTLTRHERRRIKGMSLADLRDMAADMRLVGTMQEVCLPVAEQSAVILGRLAARRASASPARET